MEGASLRSLSRFRYTRYSTILVGLLVTEGASRNARMGKTRKEAIEIPKWDPKCHVLKFPVRKTK